MTVTEAVPAVSASETGTAALRCSLSTNVVSSAERLKSTVRRRRQSSTALRPLASVADAAKYQVPAAVGVHQPLSPTAVSPGASDFVLTKPTPVTLTLDQTSGTIKAFALINGLS